MQSFSGISLDEQLARHIEMQEYLSSAGGARLSQLVKPFEEIFIESIDKQVEFVRSIPLWPLRGAYWFFIRRRLWHNKSVLQQHQRGMIKLPNELSWGGSGDADSVLRAGPKD